VIQKLSERLVQRYGDTVTVFTTNAAKNCQLFWLPQAPTVPVGVERLNGVTVRRFPVFSHLGHTRRQLARWADWAKLPFRDRLRALFNGPLILGMTEAIARFEADLVLASSFPFLHMHYALRGGRRSGKPVVLLGALHTTDAWGFDRPMIYRAIGQAAAYVAYTQHERDYLIRRRIDPAKITTIGAGIDLAQFAAADGHTLRRRYGWGAAPVIGFVGNLAQRKGVHHLLAAMPQLWAAYPAAKLLLAGGAGAFTPTLEEMVAPFTAGDPHRVVILKDFKEAEKAAIFATCDLIVFPSSEESFGLVLLEAWACAKPVVAWRVGAIPSLVDAGETGLLAKPNDPADLARAMAELLADPARRRQMGQAGYDKVKQHFTWEIVTAKFRALYGRIIGEWR
jgi:type III pantothenate kinase